MLRIGVYMYIWIDIYMRSNSLLSGANELENVRNLYRNKPRKRRVNVHSY